eukprot:UN3586
MASKVSRPAAQIHQLFKNKLAWWRPHLRSPLLPRSRAGAGSDASGADEAPLLNFGTVHHYGQSIRPPWQIERICLMSFFLLSANFTDALSSAFGYLNTGHHTVVEATTFVGLLLGGVFIPMPVSLGLTRLVVGRAGHLWGMVLFSGALVVSHSSIILCELNFMEVSVQQTAFVIAPLHCGHRLWHLVPGTLRSRVAEHRGSPS